MEEENNEEQNLDMNSTINAEPTSTIDDEVVNSEIKADSELTETINNDNENAEDTKLETEESTEYQTNTNNQTQDDTINPEDTKLTAEATENDIKVDELNENSESQEKGVTENENIESEKIDEELSNEKTEEQLNQDNENAMEQQEDNDEEINEKVDEDNENVTEEQNEETKDETKEEESKGTVIKPMSKTKELSSTSSKSKEDGVIIKELSDMEITYADQVNQSSKYSGLISERSETRNTMDYKCLPILPENRKTFSALTPITTFGFNRFVPIINLTSIDKCFIFYACSHVAVIYDYFHNESLILQGHNNNITCTAASRDKRWLVSGDKGEKDSMVIIWDANTGLPVRTMFEPHPNGVEAVGLTPDARYLATMSAEHSQTFAIWDWTNGEEYPLCSATLSVQFGIQNRISFCEDDIGLVATNSESQVLFYQWDKEGNMKYFAPSLTQTDFKKSIGKFCDTLFLSKTTKAVSATSQGLLVVWDSNVAPIKAPNENIPDKKAVKLVPIHQKPITVMTVIDWHIVTGDKDGEIKFFDFDFKLVFWYKDWKFGAITSISASSCERFGIKSIIEESTCQRDATIENNKFMIRDFIVGTDKKIFSTVGVESNHIKVIFRDHYSSVYSIHAHPTLPLVATGSDAGTLLIWNYETKMAIKSRDFDKDKIRSICYDHKGLLIAVGFVHGVLRILDSFGLKDVVAPFHYTNTAITITKFSEDSKLLATVDHKNTTALYRRGTSSREKDWVYVARYRAHYKKIVDMMFGRFFDTNTPRLFTLGEDRRLVEYDLFNATEDNLPLLQEIRVEQSSIPLSMCWYPEENGEGFFVVANDDYKLKMFNHQTKMCRYTYLGPNYGSPVKLIRVVPPGIDHPIMENGLPQRYMAYANKNKIGLIRVPLDGNPYNYMTMIGHPRGVTDITLSFDGRYMISVGEDFIVTVWKLDVRHLEERAASIVDPMAPYYEMIEGGEFGPFMHELKNYFYYSMIRKQGIDSLDTRKVDIVIEISEASYIMRAIGFYPSEEEIENMVNELKFRNYIKTGAIETHVDLDTFLKMYINHRPPFGISTFKIQEAFRIMEKCEGKLTKEKLIEMLLTKGETFNDEELIEYLATLVGLNEIGGGLEIDDIDATKFNAGLNKVLPVEIDYKTFIENILSMVVVDDHSGGANSYRRHIDDALNCTTNDSSSQTN